MLQITSTPHGLPWQLGYAVAGGRRLSQKQEGVILVAVLHSSASKLRSKQITQMVCVFVNFYHISCCQLSYFYTLIQFFLDILVGQQDHLPTVSTLFTYSHTERNELTI